MWTDLNSNPHINCVIQQSIFVHVSFASFDLMCFDPILPFLNKTKRIAAKSNTNQQKIINQRKPSNKSKGTFIYL